MSRTKKGAKRSRYHHGDLPRALVEAAIELVAERGVEGFSLREASRTVGVDPAAAYRHFADKAGLLAEVARRGFARLAQEMEQAVEEATRGRRGAPRAAAAFRGLGAAYVRFAVQSPAQFRVMFGPYGAGSRERRSEDRPIVPYEMLKAGLDALVREKAMSAAARHHAELPAWAGVHGLASLLVDGALQATNEAEVSHLIDRVARNVFAGLRAEGAKKAGARSPRRRS